MLTGAGDTAFCAGGDLKEMAEEGLDVPPPDFLPLPGRNLDVPQADDRRRQRRGVRRWVPPRADCDLCIAADTPGSRSPRRRWGGARPWAAPLPWLVPPRVAMELLVTAEPISAERAHDLGLVNRVVPVADLHDGARQMAAGIAANAPLSVRAAKRTVYLAAAAALGELQDEADRIWEPVYRSEDAQEGPPAFREKRPPRWRSR